MSDHRQYALFIGRYQPFHDGHEALVRKVLDEGRNVCVAIRGTPIDDDNPLSSMERWAAISGVFADEIERQRVKLIILPDIEAVCYGRDVGYGIEQIELDAETEAISGTAIRAGAA